MESKPLMSPAELKKIAGRIRSLRRAATLHAIEIGHELLRAKASLPHGAFEKWVESQCEFKIRTAQDLMKLAREVTSDAEVAALMVPSTLRVYLSKGTSAAAQQLARTRLQNGERVSRKDLNTFALNPRPSGIPTKAASGLDRLMGAERQRSTDPGTDSELDRAHKLAEFLVQRLTREDRRYLLDGMTWGVWNRIFVWLSTPRFAIPEQANKTVELTCAAHTHLAPAA